MRNYARFIPGEEIDAVEQWRFGAIDTAAQLLQSQAKAQEVEQENQEQLARRQESYQEGYAAGIAQGRLQVQTEVQQQMADFLANQAREEAQKFTELFRAAQNELIQAKQVVAHGVLTLSCELARQVLRQELSVNPNVLLPVIHEALELLGAEHRSALVRMHPQDIEVLEGLISGEFAGMALTLRADPALKQGGCLVESAGMVVDASLQNRWQRAVATLGLEASWEEPNEPS
ncbi:MAG: flagellar assembly protein FliH [Comamonadaceae bacterium]|nr:MAG: flagellar assembly protein FliH [Comamonadaceae bacterium]